MLNSDLLNLETIDLDLHAETKREAIQQLVERLHRYGYVGDMDAFLEDVLAREKIQSTDMGIGVAVPHGRSEAVERTAVAVGRLPEPVVWEEESVDESQPVYAIFLLAVSASDIDTTHLDLLSRIAMMLLEEEFLKDLKSVSTPQDLLDSITTFIGEDV